jgi:hypothetical protein
MFLKYIYKTPTNTVFVICDFLIYFAFQVKIMVKHKSPYNFKQQYY